MRQGLGWVGGALVVGALVWSWATPYGHGAEPDRPYVVRDGKVDPSTYLGWQVFQARCATCHGTDATGSRTAPNLLPRVAGMDASTFVGTVLKRYTLVIRQGELGAEGSNLRDAWIASILQRQQGEIAMPAWDADPSVKPHVVDLYAYLRARADAALDSTPPVPAGALRR